MPDPKRTGGGRWLLLPVLAVLCCAGPALLSAVGVGSLGIAVLTGDFAVAVVALILLLAVAALVVSRRRKTRSGG